MQGIKFLKRAIGGFSLLLLTSSAFAETSLPYGWYLEANLGSTSLDNAPSYPGAAVSSSGVGYNANLGYKFMPYIAAEGGYTGYANSTLKNNAGNKAGTTKHYAWDIAAKGILPFYASGLEAFAKLGVQRLSANDSVQNATVANPLGFSTSSHSVTGLYLGAGLQYYFMPEFALVAQWARAQGNNSTGNSSLVSAGASFIFG
jgi:hypothetical protein